MGSSSPELPVLTLDIPLDAAALERAQDKLAAFLAGQGVDAPACYRIRLVVEELIANLMMHARFATDPRPSARLAAEVVPGEVRVVLEDAAAPFDPRATPDPAAPPSLEGEALGGLGLPLVRKMAEIRGYDSLPEGWNRTTLGFARGPRDPT